MLFRPFVNISNHRTRLLVPRHLLVRMYRYVRTYINIYIYKAYVLAKLRLFATIYHSVRRVMVETGLVKMHQILKSFSQSNAVDITTYDITFVSMSTFPQQIFRKSILQISSSAICQYFVKNVTSYG